MQINIYEENGASVIAPNGKIDHVTVGEFEEKMSKLGEQTDELVLDMNEVEYVSSAALRAILNANDQMSEKGGKLTLKNVNKKVMEIFNITGFADYLNIV
jgi:anti-sigma B factor antagonist